MRAPPSENLVLGDRLQTEIEELRLKCEDTQELYREVCVLLFFRYGMTPTANKLYQLVRKGSMSAPAEALERFWKTLREKSRVRIEHPDLPTALCEVAGEMMGAIWQRAQTLAHQNLDTLREEAQASVLLAQTSAEDAALQAKLAQTSLNEIQAQLQDCKEILQITEQKLAKEEGEKMALERQVEEGIRHQYQIQEALEAARKEFTAELEQQRALAVATEERYQADLQRIFTERDQERFHLLKIQEELEKNRVVLVEQQREAQKELRSSQQEFAAELQQQRALTSAREKRSQDDLQRAIGDLERERSHLQKIQAELEQVRKAGLEQAERDRLTIDQLRQDRVEWSQKFGEIEGALAEARTTMQLLHQQLETQMRKSTRGNQENKKPKSNLVVPEKLLRD